MIPKIYLEIENSEFGNSGDGGHGGQPDRGMAEAGQATTASRRKISKCPGFQQTLLELDHPHSCHPGSSILISNSNFENFQTELSTDRLMVEDRIVTWDPKSSKLVASSLIFLPRKSKSRWETKRMKYIFLSLRCLAGQVITSILLCQHKKYINECV